jgi:chemotaxis protein MotB
MRYIKRASLFAVAAASLLVACSPSRDEMQADIDRLTGELEQSQQAGKTLQTKISELESEIEDRDRRINEMMQLAESSEELLAEMRAEQAKRKAELATYKELFSRLKKLIDAGTIKVSFRKGRMVVELASAVLFDSGRTALKPDGKAAIEELVEALKTVAHRDLMIAGHTDTVPIRSRRFRSNWDLSTARAVEVVNYMIEKEFPPDHLSAAGFGEMDPVGDNETEEGRAQNRRIEIVLMPNLGELKGIEEMLTK